MLLGVEQGPTFGSKLTDLLLQLSFSLRSCLVCEGLSVSATSSSRSSEATAAHRSDELYSTSRTADVHLA